MWKDKLKEIIYILENSNVNEIDLSFWGTRYRVVKNSGLALTASENNNSVPVALDTVSYTQLTLPTIYSV